MKSRFSISNYSNLGQRVITAILGTIIIISSTVFSEWSYFLVFAIILAFTQMEFYKLCGLDGMLPLKSFGTFIGLLVFTFTFLEEMEIIPMAYYFLVFPLVSMIFFIKLYKKTDKKPFTGIAYTILGIIYVALPFSLLTVAAFSVDNTFHFEIIIGSLLMLWASDSGAYFAGTKFGKTKLFERVSPKKSWEGSLGGAFAAIIVTYFISKNFTVLPEWQWFCIMTIIIIAGTYGDLIESLFKRSIAIKDSGRGLPGHGGFMDRFDGLLLSTPFIVAFLKIF
ncbi:phosphatidate cytidylyltransferase [Cyclobacterium sp. 1_MG-2023]|uniref:Phosphatidate cytidylyltransferase n=1 Tax=Cyclobacterium marinum (strain ATCC 25205 / DSM 745 / LMG 13164 / NCIMB 1802) TaxID=880070 RepID=G0J2B9_CYCMS|nr:MULTISPECIES: phosphatidate cytidylyltransferase [Cyclobacterium]AEL25193.1 phosphatidate cytidylyltransferase [Cyclobacterium marinum DSM 745]MBI0400737.1 phosphatidate cytidylyltransferase [Cyclobacterium marinum]MBR9777246.1 phosphatidate cytidylyltransferase [Cytophagales bacterium]MDO6439992.1 phosphatidate cytidylyltransferase [Cyclobacterium sp. 1_MG-2023]|tara:strand:+ start:22940 stop:23779 length:840 start_codon:yes stop_codon:yes gene_type:complete